MVASQERCKSWWARVLLIMLRGGGERLGDHLLVRDSFGEELVADLWELAHGGRFHDDAAQAGHPPSTAGSSLLRPTLIGAADTARKLTRNWPGSITSRWSNAAMTTSARTVSSRASR